jgi:hypothetical protein
MKQTIIGLNELDRILLALLLSIRTHLSIVQIPLYLYTAQSTVVHNNNRFRFILIETIIYII